MLLFSAWFPASFLQHLHLLRCTTDAMTQAYRYPRLKSGQAFLIQHRSLPIQQLLGPFDREVSEPSRKIYHLYLPY